MHTSTIIAIVLIGVCFIAGAILAWHETRIWARNNAKHNDKQK